MSVSVKKKLHSWCYLRNFPGLQRCATLEAVVFGMKFYKKELHYRLQSKHLRNLVGVSLLVMLQTRFPKISRRTTFWNTQMQVIEFLTELYHVEVSPITLLKSGALLEILENQKTHRKYFRWSQFSVYIYRRFSGNFSNLFPNILWEMTMTWSFYRLVESL